MAALVPPVTVVGASSAAALIAVSKKRLRVDVAYLMLAWLLSSAFTVAFFGANYLFFRMDKLPAMAATLVAAEAAGLGMALWLTYHFLRPKMRSN